MEKFTIRPVILKHKANKKGMTTVKIAVTVNRKVTYMSTSHKIHKDKWDEEDKIVKNHPSAKRLNIAIQRDVADLHSRLLLNTIQYISLSKKVIKGDQETE